MYKSNGSKGLVYFYLSNIHDIRGVLDLKPSPRTALIPRFACAAPTSYIDYAYLNLGYNPWSRCANPLPVDAPPQSFYADGTAYIFICPSFFSQTCAPGPSQYRCPQVVGNRYSGDVDAFYRSYQMYTILYELIRFYLGKLALNAFSRPKESFDWNTIIRYGVEESVKNPTNMLLYSACE